MATNRPSAVNKTAYIELDYERLVTTGEIITKGTPIIAPTISTKVPRGKFEITYTAELFGIIEKLGNKKIQVLSYLLDNKDANNSLNTSIRKIAAATDSSTKTVNDTIQILKDAGLLKREGTVYMISPDLMIKGSQIREAYLMRKYIEMDDNTLIKDNVVDAEINPQLRITETGNIVQDAK